MRKTISENNGIIIRNKTVKKNLKIKLNWYSFPFGDALRLVFLCILWKRNYESIESIKRKINECHNILCKDKREIQANVNL